MPLVPVDLFGDDDDDVLHVVRDVVAEKPAGTSVPPPAGQTAAGTPLNSSVMDALLDNMFVEDTSTPPPRKPKSPKASVNRSSRMRLIGDGEPDQVISDDDPYIEASQPVAPLVDAEDFSASGDDIQRGASQLRVKAIREIEEIMLAWRQDPKLIKASLDAAKTIISLAGGTPEKKTPEKKKTNALEAVAAALLEDDDDDDEAEAG